MSVIVPLLVGVNLYQMVFGDPTTHVGIGSVVWVVAPELSFVSVKEPLANVMLIAFAKLSFVGAGAITTNVGNVTVDVVTVVPPPGGGFCTPREFVLPKPAMKLAGIVAVSCVELTNVVAIGVPARSGFINTSEVEEKPVPFTVIVVAFEFTGALAGLTGELIVGGTKNGERKPVAGCGRDAHRNLWRSRSTEERGRNGGGQLGISTRSGRNRRTVPFDRSPGQPASIDREGKLGGTSQRRNRRNRRNMGADKRKIVQHNVPRPAPMSGSAKCSRCAMQLERKYGCSRQARA